MSTTAPTLDMATLAHGDYRTAYVRAGSGPDALLLHGSGPGVSALANWSITMTSELASDFTFWAPDIVGFGASECTSGRDLTHADRVRHVIAFIEAAELGRVSIVGNSMGGGLALAVAHQRPDLVNRLVLMGTAGVGFPLTPEVDELYGYEPSMEAMEGIIRLMAWDTSRVTPELVRMRYEATLAPGAQARFRRLFPAPRQQVIDDQALPDEALAGIEAPTLLIHGVHDRIVPLTATSLHLAQVMPNADLLGLGRCGHWAQVERSATFRAALRRFLAGGEP
jgi:pimeloyl-ACP methyl ester carboxylesterase